MPISASLLALAALGAQDAATPTSSAKMPAKIPSEIAFTDCYRPRLPQSVLCGQHQVPEDRAHPQARMIDLNIVVLPAIKRPAEPDPLFILAGGPGQSAVAIAPMIRATFRTVNRDRDIVLLDQRGTGDSHRLDCGFDFEALAFDASAKREAVVRCIRELDANVRHYRTDDHIADLEDVRRAMGFEQINLYGGSYGTRVAQVYMRDHPQSLRAVIMDAVAPMDMRIGLTMGADAHDAYDRLSQRCREEQSCAERFGSLDLLRDRLLDELLTHPRNVSYPDPATGEMREDFADHRVLALGLRALLYSPQTHRTIPILMDEALDGNFLPFVGLSNAATQGIVDAMEPGLMLAVLCTEDLDGLTQDDIPQRERDSFIGTAQIDEFLDFCADWPTADHAFDRTPATSSVPALLLSGGLDPVTPPAGAQRVADLLPRARHIVVPNGGHTVAGTGCVTDLIGEFIVSADPETLDPTCVNDFRAPAFFTSLLGPEQGSTEVQP